MREWKDLSRTLLPLMILKSLEAGKGSTTCNHLVPKTGLIVEVGLVAVGVIYGCIC